MMEWRHLPVQGGLYDQHPDFLEKARYIMMEQAKFDKQKEEAEKRKSMGPRPKNSSRGGY